jgi:predicted dehydrogenase
MAHTVEACREIVTKCNETGKFVQCGHQRRYNPEYNHALKGIIDGRIGRVAHIEAQWHRNTDWRRPLPKGEELSPEAAAIFPDMERLINWRIYEQFSGGMMSELATHHLEVINWLLGGMPKRVYASGGIDYWRDGRDTCDNVALCYEYELTPRMHGFGIIDGKNEHMDMAKINRPYTVRVTWSGLLQNRYAGASMMVSGDTGSFELRERGGLGENGCYWHDEGELWYLDANGEKITDPDEIFARDSAGRSSEKELILKDSVPFENELDPSAFEKHSLIVEMEMFAKHIMHGGHPRTNEMCGLMAAIDDIAGLEALATGSPVDIDPAWYTFDFETPNPFMYEGNDETPA